MTGHARDAVTEHQLESGSVLRRSGTRRRASLVAGREIRERSTKRPERRNDTLGAVELRPHPHIEVLRRSDMAVRRQRVRAHDQELDDER